MVKYTFLENNILNDISLLYNCAVRHQIGKLYKMETVFTHTGKTQFSHVGNYILLLCNKLLFRLQILEQCHHYVI